MKQLFRALLISGFATGLLAVVLKTLSQESPSPQTAPAEPGLEELTDDEQRMLLQELEAHV